MSKYIQTFGNNRAGELEIEIEIEYVIDQSGIGLPR
jgi:hypothetical protein